MALKVVLNGIGEWALIAKKKTYKGFWKKKKTGDNAKPNTPKELKEKGVNLDQKEKHQETQQL